MAAKLMQALWYDSYGGGAAGLKRVETPIPTPKNDEVLVKVEASSINPIDWKIQNGMLRPVLPRKFPFIPLTDIAGEVVELGSGVKNFKTGDKVVAKLNDLGGGGLAEYAVAKENLTVARPAEVSAAEGASLVTAGLTALQTITDAAGLKLDKSGPQANVLVTAASGGVGHYAVQLAKLGNIHVTATSGARNIDLVKSLGADEVIDYKSPEGAAVKSPSGKKYDAVINCTTGIRWTTFEPQLADNGKVVDMTPGAGTFANFALKKLTFSKKTVVPFLVSCKAENLEYLVNLSKEGKLKISPPHLGFRRGQKVNGDRSGGGLAEYAVENQKLTVPRPPQVSAPEAAALVTAGITALQTITHSAGLKLDKSGPQANVLITAASGGVGHYAVQLAKLGNIHVTATSGARNIGFVKSLGADEVIDYKTPEGAAVKSPSGKKYDYVINCTTGIRWSTFAPQLSDSGKVIDMTPGAGTFANFELKKLTFSKKTVVPFLVNCNAESLEFLLNLVKEGKLKTVIDSKYPLSRAEDAWAKSMSGHAVGKIIIEHC